MAHNLRWHLSRSKPCIVQVNLKGTTNPQERVYIQNSGYTSDIMNARVFASIGSAKNFMSQTLCSNTYSNPSFILVSELKL